MVVATYLLIFFFFHIKIDNQLGFDIFYYIGVFSDATISLGWQPPLLAE